MALARALVNGAPDAGDSAFWDALGIPPAMRAGIAQCTAVQEVWPENRRPLQVFSALMTQWRTGMGGPTGLDYAAVPAVMDLLGIKPRKRAAVFSAIQVMESEALRVMAAKHGNR